MNPRMESILRDLSLEGPAGIVTFAAKVHTHATQDASQAQYDESPGKIGFRSRTSDGFTALSAIALDSMIPERSLTTAFPARPV